MMAEFRVRQLGLLIATMAFVVMPWSLALHIETSPEPFTETMHDELNISCKSNDPSDQVKDVVTLELAKDGGKPIAILRHKGLVMGPGSGPNMEVSGRIDKEAGSSFLSLTIKDPGRADAGRYECLMFYLDQEFQIQEEKAVANVTVDNRYFSTMVSSLMKKVASLEQMVQDQEKRLQERDDNYTAFSFSYNNKDDVKQGETLIFRNPILNLTGDYSPETGVFTAPRKGIYVFSVSVITKGSGNRVDVHLVVNDVAVSGLLALDRGSWDQSSATSPVSLEKGDVVKPVAAIVSGANKLDPDSVYSVFSGYLVKAL